MLTGDAYSSGNLVPSHLGYVLLVETNPFPELVVILSGLCTSNIPRYFPILLRTTSTYISFWKKWLLNKSAFSEIQPDRSRVWPSATALLVKIEVFWFHLYPSIFWILEILETLKKLMQCKGKKINNTFLRKRLIVEAVIYKIHDWESFVMDFKPLTLSLNTSPIHKVIIDSHKNYTDSSVLGGRNYINS